MPVAIVGSGRSGTSMVTGMLGRCGLFVGDEKALLASDEQNARSHWEHVQMRAITDRVLDNLSGRYGNAVLAPAGWQVDHSLAPLYQEARDLVKDSFADRPVWGWNYPQTSLVIPFWREVVPDLRFVMCMRNPLDAISSFAASFAYGRPHAAEQWLLHALKVLIDTTPEERFVTFYEEYFPDYRKGLVPMLEYIGLPRPAPGSPVDRDISEFQRVGLNHSQSSTEDLLNSNEASYLMRELYMQLLSADRHASNLPILSQAQIYMPLLGKLFAAETNAPPARHFEKAPASRPHHSPSSEQPIAVFHHIAKTAGTTLRLVFKQFYGPDEILYLNDAHDLAHVRAVIANPDALRRIKLVYGHNACLFASIYDGPIRLITFVRDPFSRLVSHYRHSRMLRYDPYHQEAMRLSLEEYLCETHQDDFLARQFLLPGPDDGFPVLPFAWRGRLYEQALRNLREKFAFVGIAERFDESIVLLSQHMNWPRLPVYAPLNVNEKAKLQEDVSAKRGEIEQTYLAIDTLLYKQCARTFENEWNSDCERNEGLLAELRKVRGAVDELLDVRDEIQKHVAAETRPFASLRANRHLQAVKAFLTSPRAIWPPGVVRNP